MKIVVSYYAFDGTEFSTPEACFNYEENLVVHPASFARFFSTKNSHFKELNLSASAFAFSDAIVVLDKEAFLNYYKDEPAIFAQVAPILNDGSLILYKDKNDEWRNPYDVLNELQEKVEDIKELITTMEEYIEN